MIVCKGFAIRLGVETFLPPSQQSRNQNLMALGVWLCVPEHSGKDLNQISV